jgi:alkylation response protein AidB-like acyl-CoA dehydrogenase
VTRPAVSASPRAGWRLDRTVGLTLLLAFGVQTLGAAAWAGAAAERIAVLERRLDRHADVAERLARLEAQGEAARVALARIEARLDRGGAP